MAVVSVSVSVSSVSGAASLSEISELSADVTLSETADVSEGALSCVSDVLAEELQAVRKARVAQRAGILRIFNI